MVDKGGGNPDETLLFKQYDAGEQVDLLDDNEGQCGGKFESMCKLCLDRCDCAQLPKHSPGCQWFVEAPMLVFDLLDHCTYRCAKLQHEPSDVFSCNRRSQVCQPFFAFHSNWCSPDDALHFASVRSSRLILPLLGSAS